jgi:hypothetical protein
MPLVRAPLAAQGLVSGCHSAGARLETPHTKPRAPRRTSAGVLPAEMYNQHQQRVAERSKMQKGAAVPQGSPSKVAPPRSMHGSHLVMQCQNCDFPPLRIAWN